jgi:methylornithine synthase
MGGVQSLAKIKLEIADEKAVGILGNALDGRSPSRGEMAYLSGKKGTDVNLALFQTARQICERSFAKKVFAYGFVYFSTFCRNSCNFCYYRKPNKLPPKYRLSLEETIEAIAKLDRLRVHLVDLTMGEDPDIIGAGDYDPLLEICRAIRDELDLPVMVSPGVVPREVLADLKKAGADWYALYQETHNRRLFVKLRPGQSFDDRARARKAAMGEGLLTEDGILLGVGESANDVINSIIDMKASGVQQARAMGLAPQAGTPFGSTPPPPILDEMRSIALMRLAMQDRLIPASYDVDGAKGLELRLMAGANVITSIIPPESGLHGVAQADLGISSSQRTVEGIMPYLERLGLVLGTREDYREWMEKEKRLLSGR